MGNSSSLPQPESRQVIRVLKSPPFSISNPLFASVPAMVQEEEKPGTPLVPNALPNPKSQTSSSHPLDQDPSPPKKPQSSKDFILSVARKFSAQPLQNSDPGVWGVLTAISNNARKRQQGINILLIDDENCIGRLVADTRFQIESNAVSANHCKIYRKRIVTEDVGSSSRFCISVLLKDTSTNGTYLNWERLKRNSSEAELQHGDIISLAAPPHHELAFAFVFREVINSTPLMDGPVLKRKPEELGSENKRLKGIGIGAPEGPISLDDFRSLQRSNTELRKQLESQVLTVDTLRNEIRVAVDRHGNEMKELKESVSQSYLDQIKKLQHLLDVKQKELVEVNRISAERQHAMEDLNERLSACMQSRIDAVEIVNSQKASISELEARLDEERDQRREEREKAVADLKAALQRAQSEAQEESKRQCDTALRREKEQQEVINKLQELEKERCLLVETLRTKLEDTRQKLVISDNKLRQLEAQIREEQLSSANGRKINLMLVVLLCMLKQKVEELEHEMKGLRKELESEKAAREEAWAKVSTLELEINAAVRDLACERHRLKGARERIMLRCATCPQSAIRYIQFSGMLSFFVFTWLPCRETQLRAFYSTTEEISVMFTKQQEQLKAMQRTLEDEENYDNTSVDIDLNAKNGNITGTVVREKVAAVKDSSAASTPRVDRIQIVTTSNDDASDTEKHDCEIRSQEDHHTQDAECTSTERSVKGGFGSDIDGAGTAPTREGDPIDTDQVLETESPVADINFGERNIELNKCSTLAGDTMQLDDMAPVQENEEQIQRFYGESAHCSQSNAPLEVLKAMEDTEAGGTIKTADLLASEIAGSWALSTAPSVHGENESPRSGEDSDGDRSESEGAAALHCSNGQAAESQTVPSFASAANKLSQERQALNEMIEIVAPNFKDQFAIKGGACDAGRDSDSDTEGGGSHDSDENGHNAEGESPSDADTKEGSHQGDEDNEVNDLMDECDDATQEDSLG
ncbi:hypothetical protein HHK36_000320 [Tetracentron sinense]|uniref:FHA domain-containing protein n=1 Tax=Tetracentron sinense TaxID=13715 RepID=A0A835A1E9_TETSI|nr:hypothetical protein HHK36_000320 [Tetracentron sinense]